MQIILISVSVSKRKEILTEIAIFAKNLHTQKMTYGSLQDTNNDGLTHDWNVKLYK